MNVVLDTNVFISSLLNPAGTPGKIVDLWKVGRIFLCISQEILEEYLEVIARFGISQDPAVASLLKLFEGRHNQVYASKTSALTVIEDDPHDNKFIECAISGDKHLLKRKEFQGVRILTPAAFLRVEADRFVREGGGSPPSGAMVP